MGKSRKLPMEKRSGAKERSVSFTKRRYGLFNKAAELCMFCDAELAVFVSSPCSRKERKTYSLGHPGVDFIINSFLKNHLHGFSNDYGRDNRSKQVGLSLFHKNKSLEAEIDGTMKATKRLQNLEKGISSVLEYFKDSKSMKELEAVVDGLEKLIVRTKGRIACIPSNENDRFQSDYRTNNNTASTSKDFLMFQETIPESSSFFGYNDKGKGKLGDSSMMTELLVPNYFSCVDDCGGTRTSNSRQEDNWSNSNICSTSNYLFNHPSSPLAYGIIDNTTITANHDIDEDSIYFDGLWSY